jgi:hypothetical protein
MSQSGTTHESNMHDLGEKHRSEDRYSPPPEIIDHSGHESYRKGWENTDEQIKKNEE